MREHLERELKLVPRESFRLTDLGEPLPQRVFDSTYHDTEDLRLARYGITLRHRAEEGQRLWQLKIPTGASRIELELTGPPARPPKELTDLLVVHLRDRPLVKVARLRTRRQTVRRDGAEVVEDAVAVYEAQRVIRRFREVEVELLDGDERALRRLERSLREAGAEPGVFTPKLYRALDLSLERETPTLTPDAQPAEAIGVALAEQRRQLIEHDPGTRLGADPEDLHQMRVATRRARAFLRAARDLLDPEWEKGLRVELGWLGSALGPARDADVLHEHLRGEVERVGDGRVARRLLRALEEERDRAREAAVGALSADRYFALLERLGEAAAPPLVAGGEATLSELWRRELKRATRAFSRLDDSSPDEELHAARIRAKRARYAAELAQHELGEPGRRFVDAAKKLQDVLGEHQDSVVAEEWIASWAGSHPAAAPLADGLVTRERRRRKRARAGWPKAWKRLERRAREAQRG